MKTLSDLASWMKTRMTDKLRKLSERKPKVKRYPISLSSAGRCERASMYALLDTKGIAWGWRQRISFDDGDYVHNQVRKYLKSSLRSSHFSLDGQEETVYLNVKGWKIKGHIDGLITRLCDCELHKDLPRKILLEVKSTGQYGYFKYIKGDISIEYRSQVTAYMAALGIKHTLFLFKNKNNGELAFVPYELDETLLQSVMDRYHSVKLFKEGYKQPDEMGREYGPNKVGKLPFNCNYCPYILKCWKEFKPGRSKPGVNVYELDAMGKEYPEVLRYPDEGDK